MHACRLSSSIFRSFLHALPLLLSPSLLRFSMFATRRTAAAAATTFSSSSSSSSSSWPPWLYVRPFTRFSLSRTLANLGLRDKRREISIGRDPWPRASQPAFSMLPVAAADDARDRRAGRGRIIADNHYRSLREPRLAADPLIMDCAIRETALQSPSAFERQRR